MGISVNGKDGEEFLYGNNKLGPIHLPTSDSDPILHFLLHGYSRFSNTDAQKYLDQWWNSTPGKEEWNWPNPSSDGFLLDRFGKPLSSTVTLKVGGLVNRSGKDDTPYFAPFATPFRMRSLPTANLNFDWYPYGAYQVVKPFHVLAGLIAPGFGQPGMGSQYKTALEPYELVKISNAELQRLYSSML